MVSPRGSLPGLDDTLRDVLRSYRAGDVGIEEVSARIQVVMDIPAGMEYGWVEDVTAAYTAGQSTAEVVFTVPGNERAYLAAWVSERLTGDNDLRGMRITYPVGYWSGTGAINLVRTTAGVTRMFWPDMGNDQAINLKVDVSPVLLEPGTLVELEPGGAGVAASTFYSRVLLRRWKIARALPP